MRRLVWIALAACGGDDNAKPDAAMSSADAAIDAPGFGSTCTGACQTTALVATMMATRTLDRAYFGISTDGTLHIEAYLGGGTGCPEMNSPTPQYSLILGRVPMPASSAMLTSPGNFLDYEGDMLPSPMLGQAATAVSLTPVAYMAGTFVALDASLTFPAGTVAGHLYATHCTSLDD